MSRIFRFSTALAFQEQRLSVTDGHSLSKPGVMRRALIRRPPPKPEFRSMDYLKLPLEELLYLRLGLFFDQLHGRKVPDLYRVLMDQVDRAVLRQAIERSSGQMANAAE